MKRLLLYGMILLLALTMPVNRVDVGSLRPVEVVAVYENKNGVMIATDTGDVGIGKNAKEALANMCDTSPAVIYLDTAEYLLVQEGKEMLVEELRAALKPTVGICSIKGKVDLKHAADYLPVHGRLPKLRKWSSESKLPVLKTECGRLIFEEK